MIRRRRYTHTPHIVHINLAGYKAAGLELEAGLFVNHIGHISSSSAAQPSNLAVGDRVISVSFFSSNSIY